MLAVLGATCAGSFWSSQHLDWRHRLPAHDAPLVSYMLGWPGAAMVQLGFLAVLALLLRPMSRPTPTGPGTRCGSGAAWTGAWPLAAGALLQAICNLATLLADVHPWSITWGLAVWGARAATLLGWHPASSVFWREGGQRRALDGRLHGWLRIAAGLPGTWLGIGLRRRFGLTD